MTSPMPLKGAGEPLKWEPPSPDGSVLAPFGKSPIFFEEPLFLNPSNTLALGSSPWRLGTLWSPSPWLAQLAPSSGTQAAPTVAAPAAPKPMTNDQIWKLVIDLLSLVEDMDAKGKGMTVNGGIASCRFAEFSLKSNKKEDGKHCLVMFEKDTQADVDLYIRKTKGKNESRITGFRLSYNHEVVRDVFPDNQVPITGFEFIPSQKVTPFYQEADPPVFAGYGIKYMPTRAGLLDIPVLGYPFFKLFGENAKELEFTKDYLSSWGLDSADWYKDAHTQRYRVPQRVSDFLSLIRHGDMNPPAWININKEQGKPDLFDWLSFRGLEINGHLREGSIEIPNVGSFQISRAGAAKKLRPLYEQLQKLKSGCEYDKVFQEYTKLLDQTAKIEIRGDRKKLTANLINAEFPRLSLVNERFDVQISGLKAKSTAIDMPPLHKLVDEMKKGNLNPKFRFKGAHADKIVVTDLRSGLKTTIQGADLSSLEIAWPGSFQMSGLSAVNMELSQPSANLTLQVKGPTITSGGLTLKKDKSELKLAQLGAESLQLAYMGSSLNAGKSTLTNFTLKHGSDGSVVGMESIESKGDIAYGLDSEFSFKTSGQSKLKDLKLTRTVNASGTTELEAQIGLSGNISKFSVKRGDKFSADFSESVISSGKIEATALLSDDPTPKLTGVKYSLAAKVEKITLDKAQLGPLTVSPSKVLKGSILVSHDTWDLETLPRLDISGSLDLHVDQFTGNSESFNLPGFSVSGALRDVALTGDARFQMNGLDWSVTKPASTDPKPLKLSARLEDMTVSHDPNAVKKAPGNKKSEMKIKSAKFVVDDVEKIDFAPGDKTAGATSGIRSLKIKGIRFEEIDAGGIVWVKLPLLSYLPLLQMGKIGAVSKGPDMSPSLFKLGSFEMSLEDGKPVIRFRDFETELYEVGGKSQYAKVKIPTLKISPQGTPMVDTEGGQIDLDLKLNHPFDLQIKPEERPLDQRRSRVVPKK